MKGIRFGEYHSYNDLRLILSSKEIGSPAVKENYIDLPGTDGAIDQTDFFGEPKYDNVTHKFEFSSMIPYGEFLSQYSTIKNAIHGRKLRIILDDDPLFFWMGRCRVSPFTTSRLIGAVTVECECEPYKYRLEKTAVTRTINGAETITLTNARKRAVPEVTIATESTMHLVFQGVNVWDLGSGVFTLPELELTEGENPVEVSGTGTITFTWQEGML